MPCREKYELCSPLLTATLFLFTTFHKSLKSWLQYARKVLVFFFSVTNLRSLTRFHSCFTYQTHMHTRMWKVSYYDLCRTKPHVMTSDDHNTHAVYIWFFFFYLFFAFLIHVKRVYFCPIFYNIGHAELEVYFHRQLPFLTQSYPVCRQHTPT